MDLNWSRGVASTDAWAGSLDGAVMALDGHQITHLLVKRGLLFPKRFAVPFDRLARVDQEGLYLDLSILELLSSPIARETGDGSPEVELSRQTRLLLADGARARLTGLRLFQGKRAASHLLVRCGGSRRSTSLLPVSLVAEFGPTQMTAHVGSVDVDGLPTYRVDQDVANDLWESLYGSGEISLTDLNGIRVRVDDSIVSLEGNVRTASAGAEAERIARSVNGVAGVTNRLVSDWEIDLAVASYISRTAPQMSTAIAVHTQLGTVQLEGHPPSTDALDEIAQGIRSMPGVLDVQDLTEIRPPAPPARYESSPAESDAAREEEAAAEQKEPR